jgi:hypothetical protein
MPTTKIPTQAPPTFAPTAAPTFPARCNNEQCEGRVVIAGITSAQEDALDAVADKWRRHIIAAIAHSLGIDTSEIMIIQITIVTSDIPRADGYYNFVRSLTVTAREEAVAVDYALAAQDVGATNAKLSSMEADASKQSTFVNFLRDKIQEDPELREAVGGDAPQMGASFMRPSVFHLARLTSTTPAAPAVPTLAPTPMPTNEPVQIAVSLAIVAGVVLVFLVVGGLYSIRVKRREEARVRHIEMTRVHPPLWLEMARESTLTSKSSSASFASMRSTASQSQPLQRFDSTHRSS